MRRLSLLVVLVLLPLAAAAGPPAEVMRAARDRFDRANRLYHDGRYAEALHLYQAAYDLLPAPQFLFNLALAREKTFDYEGCATAMRQFLQSATAPEERQRAELRLAGCRVKTLVPVRVSSMPPSAAIVLGEGARRTLRGRTPARLELPPGSYRVTVEMPGYQSQRQDLVVEVGDRPEIDFALDKLSSLRVEADVSGALVQLGDTPGEPAPFQREVPAGLYRLRVHKAGHRLVASASPDAPFAARPRTGHLATLDLERPLDEELRILERHRILQALEAEGGNQTRAAARLRMPRRTLVSRLASLGIDGPRRRRRGPAPPADDKE